MATKAPSLEDQGSLNVKNLSSGLSTVPRWYQLGIKLGLQPSQLRQIEQHFPKDIDRCKIEMVDLWLQSTPGASWRHIVTALRELGDFTTAERIESKYVKGTRADSNQEEMSKAAVFAFENRQVINEKFAVFQMNVCNKMLKNGVNTREFRFFVAALFPPGDCIPQSPTDLTEVFEAITYHRLWDCLHYSPLVQIVQNFGAGDPEMKAWIQNYKKDLKAYTIVASIEDCIDSNLDTCTDQSRVECAKYNPHYNCPVEWKTNFVDHSLQYLTDVWEMFSDRYLLPDSPPTALLDQVRKGCVSVTWLVPSYLIPQLIERVKIDTEFFQKHHILKVTVRGEIVYEEEVAKEATEEPQFAHQKETPITKVTMGYEGRAEMGQPPEKPTFTQKETFGGYNCEFVEALPRAFQMECPICHLILREPYLVGCCGTNFCHTCIQRRQADNSHCPTCREDNFEVFPNKGLNRSLKQLQIYCIHRNDGCQWRGKLGELDQHLNICKECPLTVFEKEEEKEDAKQGSLMAESELLKQEVAKLRRKRHEDRAKLQRYTGVFPVELMMTNFEEMKRSTEEWYSSPFYTHPQGYKMCLSVDANGHGDGKGTHVSVFARLMRGEFDDHLKWPFQGRVIIQLCNQLQDKYHHGHTIDFSETTNVRNISRVSTGGRAGGGWGWPTLIPHNDLNFNPTNNCQYLQNDCLHLRIVAVESLSEPGVLPTERTMTNFEQYRRQSDSWLSTPFYTHPQGYKMCLIVDANGYDVGKGTHISVFAYLMRGEFDDHLEWPFQGRVVFQLCNQLQDKYHHGLTIDFSETTDSKCISRVTTGDRAGSGEGYSTLISHNDLNFNPTKNCQYLKNDCLHFQIVAVESLSEPGVLPTELTMTNFERHKTDSDNWYSPPFYTHSQGYMMCLRVDANGDGDGVGTNVSVFAYLMRGEFDDHLKWPFRGHVTVAILNQLEDNNHTTYTIRFTESTNNKAIGRVVEGERATGWGYPTFIAHTELNYNPTKNCQYLKYDCLRFRIIKVELK